MQKSCSTRQDTQTALNIKNDIWAKDLPVQKLDFPIASQKTSKKGVPLIHLFVLSKHTLQLVMSQPYCMIQ